MSKKHLDDYMLDIKLIYVCVLHSIKSHNIVAVNALNKYAFDFLDDVIKGESFGDNEIVLLSLETTNPFDKQDPFYVSISLNWIDATPMFNVEFGCGYDVATYWFAIKENWDEVGILSLTRYLFHQAERHISKTLKESA